MNVNIKINNMPLTVPAGTTILEAARQADIEIPTLCYMKELNQIGACRICMVEIKGAKSLAAACVFPVADGMEVLTNTPRVHESRRGTLELILSTHDRKCLSCLRSGSCELQTLCHTYKVDNEAAYDGENHIYDIDKSTPYLERDNNKCILCRRCSAVCRETQDVGVIGANERGFNTHIGCAFDLDLDEVSCVACGQCVAVCPTGALTEVDDTAEVWEALNNPAKHVVVQTAPAVRAALGEGFGLPVGTDVTGKMTASLRRLGFHGVFDTVFGADLTIMEEAAEFIDRVQNNGVLPIITSCSPGWVKYCEHYFPEFIPNLSSCKSPQQMFGAITKTWYAKNNNLDPKDIVVVSVMPCIAKKFEIIRDDQAAAGVPDVDVVITTRELARMIKRAGLDFSKLPDEDFDNPLGVSTGAGLIFGATGGVTEAALRTAVEWITGKESEAVDFKEVRGIDGMKEAEYNVGGIAVKIAVVSGLSNARKLFEQIKSGEKSYHLIEIMACPGGCVNGGGQPIQTAAFRDQNDLRKLRGSVLYNGDKDKPTRKSHENPVIKKLYDEYLEKPGSHKAHDILHTGYVKRDV